MKTSSTINVRVLSHYIYCLQYNPLHSEKITNLYPTLLLVRSPGSMPCPNYEVVEFQPLEQWTIHTLDSGCPARIL